MKILKKYYSIMLLLSFFAFTSTVYAAEETTIAETTTIASETPTSEFTPKSIAAITLNKTNGMVITGKKIKLKATVKYSAGNGKKENVQWVSKNTKIASVSSNGTVKAISAGKTTIICCNQKENIIAKYKLTVINPYNRVKSIKLDEKQIRLNKGDKRVLSAFIKYGKNKKYQNEEIIWKSSKPTVAKVNKDGVVTGKSNGTTYVTVRSKYTKKAVKCKVVVAKTKYVAITFDDGPGRYTNKLLDALEKYDYKATFFIVGNSVGIYKQELLREYKSGMEIGSHSYNHPNFNTISASQISWQINTTANTIKKVTGSMPSLLRPPYGNYNSTVSRLVDVPMIYWSVDTLDWKNRNAAYVCRTVLNSAKDGDIILLHDVHPTSVDGFISALPTLKKRGFELVTVSQLYKIKGKKLTAGKMHYGTNID